MSFTPSHHKKRTNGLMWPPSFQQLMTFVLLIFNKAVFGVFILPNAQKVKLADLVAVSVIWLLAFLFSFIFGFWTTSIDPEDPIVEK